MNIMEKLTILADAAKYDAACTSSGSDRRAPTGGIGSTMLKGCCHSFSADGRCITLLKVLQSNACVYDCEYCINRRSEERPRATFLPRELADLTMEFYRRNYIEGLFLSSGVVKNPDYTVELMCQTLAILRNEYRFGGYIHAKAIPGADSKLLYRLGLFADRMSVNIELPSSESLALLAPQKSRTDILKPMAFVSEGIVESRANIVQYKNAPQFAPAGQSTQMIVGASPESDRQILSLSSALYKKYKLKRVFFSAYMPVVGGTNLPTIDTKPPLLREHRLYQADWLMRFYHFDADEILDEANPNLDPLFDPKCGWALRNLDRFPIEVNTADYEALLRVPGVGVRSAMRIIKARRTGSLAFDALKKLGVVLKRAKYFLLCQGKAFPGLIFTHEAVLYALLSETAKGRMGQVPLQLSLFDEPDMEDKVKCLSGEM